MPALPPGAVESPPCACCHHLGQPPIFNHPYNSIIPRKLDRKLQTTYPLMGRGYFGKPYLGTNSYNSPFFNSQNAFHTIHSENSPVKPRIVTVVKPGNCAVRKITLLLNRRSVQTFEQLIADISEALGLPRWKNDHVRKLFSLKGKEVGSISDFFRGDDVFIAVGQEQLTMKNIEMVIEDLYPDSLCRHRTIKGQWRPTEKGLGKPMDQTLKVDSGFEEAEMSKTCCGAKSPRITSKHEEKAQSKVRHMEAVRVKKWDREKWHREQGRPAGKLGDGKNTLIKDKNSKSKMAEGSLNDTVRCEQCRKERQLRHKLHSERQVDALLDAPHSKMGDCQRYHLERKTPIESCKKSTGSTRGGEEFEWHGKDCESHHPHNDGHLKELEKQQGMSEKMVDNSLQEKEPHERQIMQINTDTVEPQQSTKIGRAEPRKRGSFCKMRDICKIAEDVCQVEAEGQTKTCPKDNIQDTQVNGWDSKAGKVESDLERTQEKGRFTVPSEGGDHPPRSVTEPPLLKCRLDVENFYEIGRTIGDGNFAIVKECRVRSVNEQYAMKIIDKSKLKGKEDMIENEISIIKCLSHPNIVKLLDEYETETKIYLIMEYVKGGDLFDAIIESVRFTEHDAALMIADLCQALLYIHRKNIVHRDLKPENLLIQHNPDKSTTLKLADFGLAVHVTEPIFTVCGTPTYVAPEILLEKAAKDLISKLLVVDPKKRFTASQVLQHHWISSGGKRNDNNLQREVTMNIERHFLTRRRQDVPIGDQ
ncbi:serine/threonine-protein kinase DCLK3 isoform X2 [Ambystoma mexicanum]|uniref:serine/threonine-protein kinase DCLK3 isoform X2 n=1 Tax=Ambystoma mexicanum TaxID=8296 RepID=UPI0037E95E4C